MAGDDRQAKRRVDQNAAQETTGLRCCITISGRISASEEVGEHLYIVYINLLCHNK